MDEVLPGLFVGGLRDAQDSEQLAHFRIEAVISILDFERTIEGFGPGTGKEHLMIKLSDCPQANINPYLTPVSEFIHKARLSGKNVLLHCLVGVSRSICFAIAYILTVTNLNYAAAIAYIESKRPVARPNFGFRMQLYKYSQGPIYEARQHLRVISNGTMSFDTLFHNDCAYSHSLYIAP
uniref:Dual specificity protein phosphatase 22 n=1 Tax=Panagrellus redivivus TaxID=6233 RepID=A0A7E4VR70_PANRE